LLDKAEFLEKGRPLKERKREQLLDNISDVRRSITSPDPKQSVLPNIPPKPLPSLPGKPILSPDPKDAIHPHIPPEPPPPLKGKPIESVQEPIQTIKPIESIQGITTVVAQGIGSATHQETSGAGQWGLLIGLGLATAVLLVSPFDGPFGEVAAGGGFLAQAARMGLKFAF
jgi:hypothetical protein